MIPTLTTIKIVRIYVMEISVIEKNQQYDKSFKSIRRIFTNDYIGFCKAINDCHINEKCKIDLICTFEVDENKLLDTYNAIISATILENLLPETTINETINHLYLFYKRCKLINELNLYDENGVFLWDKK
jgi:hypothetical protein